MHSSNENIISIIIPIYNESEGIQFLVDNLNEFFQNNNTLSAEVVFVNDGSRDNSEKLLKESIHNHYKAKLVSFSKNFGTHAALRAGISASNGSLICFIYADLQDPLEIIIELQRKMLERNDIVWGHRSNIKVGFIEKSFTKFYAFLMKKFAFSNFPEEGFDILMFNRKVRSEITKNVEANSSIFLQILGMGFSQSSISYKKRERKSGVSKWTFSKKVKLFIDSFVAFSYAPIRFVTIVGIMFFIIGIIWTAYIILRELIFHNLASGWPALVSILMIGFGITNISLGIIAEYLWRTLDASRKRPVFIVDQILDLN